VSGTKGFVTPLSRLKVVTVPVTKKVGRPRLLEPLDQKVSITVTSREKALAMMEMQRSSFSSIADFVRQRSLASLDIVAWKEAAETTLVKMQAAKDETVSLTIQLTHLRRQRDQAKRKNDYDMIVVCDKMIADLEKDVAPLVKDTREKRTDRLIGRFSFANREDLAWKAEKLHLSLSDFVRMQVFDYLPGRSDQHMSEKSRKEFYEAVAHVAAEGWGARPSLEICKHCRHPLPVPHSH
jgi:hypothetical protein